MSNQSINLKDYEIVYNNGTSDAVWPLENGIVLAPGESAVIWQKIYPFRLQRLGQQRRTFHGHPGQGDQGGSDNGCLQR